MNSFKFDIQNYVVIETTKNDALRTLFSKASSKIIKFHTENEFKINRNEIKAENEVYYIDYHLAQRNDMISNINMFICDFFCFYQIHIYY